MFKKIILGFGLFLLSFSITHASCYDIKLINTEYTKCRVLISGIFTQGYNAYSVSNYPDAVMYYERYLIENGDYTDQDYISARLNLSSAYSKLGNTSFYKKEYRSAVDNFLNAIGRGGNSYELQYNLSLSYYNLGEYPNAGLHSTNAYKLATEKKEIEDSRKLLDDIELKIRTSNAISSAVTNDSLVYLQYYITDLNIPIAWQQITNPKQVIVAVIDDGININHPDLTKNIWISRNSTYGGSKIISFQNDGLADNATAGEHGTMVAGIIGATTGNAEGIAGIAKNVKLMPIRIFDTNGNTKEEFIIKAIDYAIENEANIINMSLEGSQFKYSKGMNEVIKKAYDKGIFVVIAGGNGDILANKQNGVNLDINPISPVCNNNGSNYSFGVYATDRGGYRTLWTNYGKCTPFFAPGVEIVSTSVAGYNKELGINYNELNGTSFSAPIVSGILALGYNKYGKIPYTLAYAALGGATTTNAEGNPALDANKYLNNIQAYYDKQNTKKSDELKKKAQIQLDRYRNQYSGLTNNAKRTKYGSLLLTLQRKSKTLKSDNLIINNKLIDLINSEISKL